MTQPRPNVVYFHTHDTGRRVQPYGHPVPMPALQRMAEQGVLFRNAFSAAPTCSPSRAALLTGQSAHEAGMLGLAHMGFGLHDYRQHLVHTLHDAGYTSAMVGVQHVAPGPDEGERIGYHEHLRVPDARAASVLPAALEYLRRDHARPFFLSVGLVETHTLPTPEGWTFGYPPVDERWVTPPSPLPDTPETRRDTAGFVAAARVVDDALAAVLDELDTSGLADETLVVVTTDHGVPLPRMKCTLSDHGTGVMLVVRGPGGFTGGRVLDGLVSQVDLFPTLCDLLDVPRPPWLRGVSLLPLVRAGEEVRDEVFSEITYHVAYEPARAVRTRRWKYVRRFAGRDRPVLPNVDDSPSKDVLVGAGWHHEQVRQEELFDLLLDPQEHVDLSGSPDHAEVLAELRLSLEGWMRETDDPLLRGPVPPPEGQRLGDVDAVSAEI